MGNKINEWFWGLFGWIFCPFSIHTIWLRGVTLQELPALCDYLLRENSTQINVVIDLTASGKEWHDYRQRKYS
jgi:hypothetical protein